MSSESSPSFFHSLRFRYGVGLLFFLAVGGFFLWEEHNAHILGYFPLILILGGCVGMHFFMHGGQGHDHGHGKTTKGENPANIDKKDVEK